MATQPLHDGPFFVRTTSGSDNRVVAALGEVDAVTAPQLADELDRALDAAQRVVVDLTGLTFIDSTGLHVLIRAWQRAEAEGVGLTLLRAPALVHRSFEVTGLDEALPFAG